MATTRNLPRTWGERREAIIKGLRDTRSELRKVTWPSRQETINLTLVVIGLSLVLGLLLGGVDLAVSEAFRWLTDTFRAATGG
jgi:preprotein translocase SecE subunit